MKKTLMVDLDGVLNQYTGKYEKGFIPPIRVGAKDFVKKLAIEYQLILFTTRDKDLATQWLYDNGLKQYFVNVTNIKEPCFLFIDDRCEKFCGDYMDIMDKIKNFNVWWK